MKYRKLRIAWSLLWGILCLSLTVLWVRSYHRDVKGRFQKDRVSYLDSQQRLFVFYSDAGGVYLSRTEFDPGIGMGWSTNNAQNELLGFGTSVFSHSISARIPHWFLVTITALLIPAPWISWSKRFSLRTLLIAMTVIAVGLGAIIYALR
jgi:hypothetical protein